MTECQLALIHLKEKLNSGVKMKKVLIATVLVGLLSVGVTNPAFARDKTIKIPRVATITYPSVVKLEDSGCQRIRFRYTAPRVSKNYGFLTVALTDADDLNVGGAALIRGSFFVQRYPQLQTLRKRGSFDITVCRAPWTDPAVSPISELSGQVSDVWPGMVEVILEANPIGFPDITPKAFGTIRFTGKFVD